MHSVSGVQLTTNSVLNWILQNKEGCIDKQPKYVLAMFFDHLREAYDAIDICDHPSATQMTLKKFDEKEYKQNEDLHFVLEVRDIVERSGFFTHFLMHGSCADFGLIRGWSDFDSIAVLKRSSLRKKERRGLYEICAQIDNVMRSLDPYQHHGVHFIHEKELLSFPNLYVPVRLLSDCKCLMSKSNIKIAQVNSIDREIQRFNSIVDTLESAASSGVLAHHAKSGKYLLEDYEDSDTMYQLKYLMCVIMLLPTLWYNLSGVYCRKSDSYDMINSQFSRDQLEFLNACSEVRFTWKKEFHDGNKIHKQVMLALGKNYLKRAGKFARLLKENVNELSR